MSKLFWKIYKPIISFNGSIHTTCILDAARRGTRMKRDAIKAAYKKAMLGKLHQQKAPVIPKHSRASKFTKLNEDSLPEPVDDVFAIIAHKRRTYLFEKALEMHKQVLHPTMFNVPNADVKVLIELTMSTLKKNHYVSAFSNILLYPHYFPVYNERTILALVATEESVEETWNAGASMVYGPECIRMAKLGKIKFKEYEHIIAHSQLLPGLVNARDLHKKQFPKPADGTSGTNVAELVSFFSKGYKYKVEKDATDPDFAYIDGIIGKLDMPQLSLEENLRALLVDIENKNNPKFRKGNLITRVWLTCPPNAEKFKIDYEKILEGTAYGKAPENAKEEDEQMKIKQT